MLDPAKAAARAAAATLALAASAAPAGDDAPARPRPVVIAHRGASGERPEHTLAAYERAIDQGADFIEPDLVITKDGVLVARHENEIGETTDVADHPEFADRRTARTMYGRQVEGWFVEDFTLAELQTLRVRERMPRVRPANARFDGLYPIPTFREVLALARAKEAETGRTIGVYPETKHPAYFASIKLPLEPPLLADLEAFGYRGSDAPIFIQSFEDNLPALAEKTDLPLIQLVAGGRGGSANRPTPERLAEIRKYARGIGPIKELVLPRNPDGTPGEPTSLVADARAAGLLVHVWTLRDEDAFLPAEHRGDPEAEYRRFYDLGVDGVFSDFPATAVRVRDRP